VLPSHIAWLFILENQMNATLTTNNINTINNTYSNYMQAGKTYGEAMQEIARKLNGTACPKLVEVLAKTHATHYKCTASIGNRGNWVFEVKGERADSARKSWERNVMVWFAKEGKPVTRKSVDPVSQLINKYKALSKAEQKRFLTTIAK
jgi:hypothetical protein